MNQGEAQLVQRGFGRIGDGGAHSTEDLLTGGEGAESGLIVANQESYTSVRSGNRDANDEIPWMEAPLDFSQRRGIHRHELRGRE